MSVVMVVLMKVNDSAWMTSYFAAVPAILEDYGAKSLAGARAIHRIEGEAPPPDRVAILSFPDMAAVDAFFSDERYQPFLEARLQGSKSEILVFENVVTGGELV